MKQARDQWLAVWDSLNDAQRSQVASMLKERQARMEQRHARMQERHGRALPRPRPRLRQRRLQPPTKRRFRRLRRSRDRAHAWPARPPTLPRSGPLRSGARAGRVLGPWLLGCRLWDLVEGWGGDSRHGAGLDPAWRAFPILMRGRGGVVPARHASGARGLAFSPSPARRHRIETWHGPCLKSCEPSPLIRCAGRPGGTPRGRSADSSSDQDSAP